jgi:hypothetical protein
MDSDEKIDIAVKALAISLGLTLALHSLIQVCKTPDADWPIFWLWFGIAWTWFMHHYLPPKSKA